MPLPSSIRNGILSLPGTDAVSKAVTEELLNRDYLDHHCYFTPSGLHNHLSHHILAAYDLGAPASLIRAIYYEEVKFQRPIDLRDQGVVPEGIVTPGEIKHDNWTQWLGDPKAYSAYVTLFSNEIAALGIVKTLEDYIFSPAANGNGSCMLFRLVGGGLHPLIQLGYGLEFDVEIVVAAGLAQTAIHVAQEDLFVSPEEFTDAPSPKQTSVNDKGRQPPRGPSILSLLRQIYDSPKLIPVLPYDPNALYNKRLHDLIYFDEGSRIAELKRIMSSFDPGENPEELEGCIEELFLACTLLAFGTGKKNRKPRVDFFLMHLLTSTLFIPAFFKYVTKIESRRALLRTFIQVWGIVLMVRGRPRIDPTLLMSYTNYPVPPSELSSKTGSSSIDSKNTENTNPWLDIIADVIHAPDSHTVKSLRTLLYGAIKYGTLPKGSLIGAFEVDGQETHPGIGEADGTVFVRAAGILMSSLGWVTHGQEAGSWDRSALGWDDAWKNED